MNQPNNQQNSSSLFLPRENGAAGKLITRRNFFKAAAATAVALPFLTPQEAHAAITYPNFIRGTEYNNIQNYASNGIYYNGVRAYMRGHRVPKYWPLRYGGPVCFTIYPTPNDFYYATGTFWDDLPYLFANAQDGDMITAWQEPEGIDWYQKKGIHVRPEFMRDLLGYLRDYKKDSSSKVLVGAISGGSKNWEESAKYFVKGLDFYALDIYRSDYRTETDAIGRLEYWQGNALRHYNEFATICVTECNAHSSGTRPCFFHRVAKWVAHQANRDWRCFHTFWGGYGAPKSGPWFPNDWDTIHELANIGQGDFGTPSLWPEPKNCG